jgi:signal transduction histidine kinase
VKNLFRAGKAHWLGFLCGGLTLGIFLVTFYLYGLPLGAVLYPTAVAALLWLCYGISRLVRTVRLHRRLTQLAALPSEQMEGGLPAAIRLTDQDYQNLIAHLRQEQTALRTQMNRQYADRVDYFTLWAHQVKTPISSMELALENEDSALARRMKGELFRVEQYVEMVLAFLRLDSASTDYVIREYSLDPILRSAVKKFAGEFISRKLSLRYEPVESTVLTDEKWLSFVVEQVLSNALKYTRTGSITISLEEGNTLCITDTGMGISPEDLPRIFEKGYTGYQGRQDHKASGIGLYLCKRICQNLGHTITAESQLDQGTTIRIGLGREKREIE